MEGRFIINKFMKRRVVVIIICAVVLLISIFQSSMVVKASENTQITYSSIEIKANDTLWYIAQKYCPSYVNMEQYIEEVKEINDITTDYIVQGNYLLIPIYK